MRTPPLLLGAALLFWGWQNGLLPVAAVAAVALEASRLFKFRLDLDESDFVRVYKFCTALFLLTAAYLYFSKGMPHAIIILFSGLPLILLPLVAVQIFSNTDTLDLSKLMLFSASKKSAAGIKVNLSYPYFALCLLAASAANTRGAEFYPALIVLCSRALWQTRSRRFPLLTWGALLLCAAVLGYGGQIALHGLQTLVEGAAVEWLAGEEDDPYRSTTQFGHIGKMKLSDKIILRVDMGKNTTLPLLLHEASYDAYSSPAWLAKNGAFSTVQPALTGWMLQTGTAAAVVTVTAQARRGKALLALPNGTIQLENLTAHEVRRNRLGAVELEGNAELFGYQALFNPAVSSEGSPTADDFRIPAREEQVVARISSELKLAGRPPQEILAVVKTYFQNDFRYSTFRDRRETSATPLAEFLLETKSGHCEYFATATTLLLRAAGIPARYATGYSVQEFSKLENRYVARLRHAHAWTRAYVNGMWLDFDATPPSWGDDEKRNAALWEPLADLWYWASFQFSKWSSGREEALPIHTAWIGLPLVVFLLWFWHVKKRVIVVPRRSDIARAWLGEDFEFYMIEKRMAELGYGRERWESPDGWLERISTAMSSHALDPLRGIVALHQRYRFDPKGLGTEERNALKAQSQGWLAEHGGMK